jgi:hypothetical protein
MNSTLPITPLVMPTRIRLRWRHCFTLLSALIGSVQPAGAQSGVPPEVAANARQWPLPHRDYAAHRAVLDSGIYSGNVARLEVAWSVPITASEARFGKAACNPIILDDAVYFQNLQSDVHAIDLATGAVKWKHKFNRACVGPNGVARRADGRATVVIQPAEQPVRRYDRPTVGLRRYGLSGH